MNIMKNLLLLSAYIVLSVSATAQPYNPEKVNKKAVTYYTLAQKRADEGNLVNAASLLKQAIETDNKYVDAYLALAAIHGKLKNYDASISAYEKAFALDSNYTLDYKPLYASRLAGAGLFDKALTSISDYQLKKTLKNSTAAEKIEQQKRCYEFAVNYAKKNSTGNYVFAPKNLGANINSGVSEYLPSLTIDSSEIVFTRRVNNSNEDFYISKRVNGQWSKSQPISGTINTPQNEGAQSISQDGERLLFTGCNRKGFTGGCDIYVTYKTLQGWSEVENMGSAINTEHWESQPCLSADKMDLYFVSSRPGGYGGLDIYVSRFLPLPIGKWSLPVNLGPEINTPGNEQCPFIHADNLTLYFTSDYWPGYGSEDIFMSRKKSQGEWEKPVNLGYPVNTVDRESSLVVSADGKTAYFSSDRADSKGGMDIYSFELRENIRPIKTLWVRGKVYDKKTGSSIISSVELFDVTTKKQVAVSQTDERGNYFVTLPAGKDYIFNVNKKGYLFYSDNFFIASSPSDSAWQKDIALQPVEKNASIILKNIFFDVNKSVIKPESQTELDKIIVFLTDNPSLKIEISGHTDNAGKPADNMELSNNRAKAVVNYLISKKVSPFRLLFKGYGETKPIGDNKTVEGRALNRRTEMKIISQ